MRSLIHRQVALSTAKSVGTGLSKVTLIAVAAAGSGYRAGDLITLTGGTMPSAPTARVQAVDAQGGVLSLLAFNSGVATAKPSSPVSTAGGSGTGLTVTPTWADDAVPDGVKQVKVTANGDLRWRDDGTSPTAGVGQRLPAGTLLEYDEASVADLKLIGEDGTASADITFYR